MFTHYRSLAFVLKQEERGEADYLFTLFSKDFGKLRILGRGIRKVKSKLRAGIPLFSRNEIEFIQGKTYKTLTDAILEKEFVLIKKSLPRLKIAYQIAELTDILISDPEQDDQIWNLLEEVFERLNNQQLTIRNQQLLYYYFFWNLLALLGYHPELYSCSICRKKLQPAKLYFSPKQGGIICAFCGTERKNLETIEVSSDWVKILRKILEKDWPTLTRLKIEEKERGSLKEVSGFYLDFVRPQ